LEANSSCWAKVLYNVEVRPPTGKGVDVDAAAAIARFKSTSSRLLNQLPYLKRMNDLPLAINLAPNPPAYPLSAGAGVFGVAPGAGLHDSDGQHLPVEVLRMEARSSGDKPRVDPRSIASAVPAMAIPSSKLFDNIACSRVSLSFCTRRLTKRTDELVTYFGSSVEI
jgi:hypothetical protein